MNFTSVIIISTFTLFYAALSFRLPTNLKPELYYLEVKTYLENEFRFEGEVKIRFKCITPTSEIFLHSRELTITEKKVMVSDVSKGTSIKIIRHCYDLPNNFYILNLDQSLVTNRTYHVTIPFRAPLEMSMLGYYRSNYKDKNGQIKWLAATKFEPTDARRAFPCFDEPAMKARFRVRLVRQNKYPSTISNMPLVTSQPLEDGWVRDVFAESVPMSTYLVAYVVSDFASLTSYTKKRMFRVWTRPEAIQQANYALQIGPKIIEYFEDYFGVDFVLPKMDFVAVPDFGTGAMENWGLCTYRETTMLYDEKSSCLTSKETVARVVAHEIAHQWFGNHVTMQFWEDLWLNEGFATYVAALGVAHVEKDWDALDELVLRDIMDVYSKDCLKSTRQVSANITKATDIQQMFDPITYQKGALLLRMMSNFLGEDTFRRGIGLYLRKFQFSNANQNNLIESLEEQVQIDQALLIQDNLNPPVPRGDLKQVMETWILQAGYPVLKVERNGDGQTATVTQNRYLIDGSQQNNISWWVPITYATEVTTDFLDTRPRYWISEQQTEMKGIQGNWLLFNLRVVAIFRVNYNPADWRALFTALQDNAVRTRVPGLSRAQIVNDAFHLARSGLLSYDIALEVLQYVRHERDNVPWRSIYASLNFLSRMTRRTTVFSKFSRILRALLTPMYTELGQNPFQLYADLPDGMPEPVVETLPKIKYRRSLLAWACGIGVSDCTQRAVRIFKSWKNVTNPDLENPVPVEVRRVVYCSGVRLGGQDAWEFVKKRYLSANVATEKENLLNALGCSNEADILEEYLEMIFNPNSGIRKQDALDVFKSVVKGSGFHIAVDFLENRIKILYEYLQPKPSVIGRYFLVIAESMNTQQDLVQLRDIIRDNRALLTEASRAVQQSLEIVELNVRWRTKYLQQVTSWLNRNAATFV